MWIRYLINSSIPRLQGTLAKRMMPMLQPDFAKEPFSPSRSIAGLRASANLIAKQIENISRQCLTMYIFQCRTRLTHCQSPENIYYTLACI